ncbi:MAG: hypothetical protein JSW07_09230 [bacterium]|nr:MAG: hypothetical protein JSW07_09230 [bacterium]
MNKETLEQVCKLYLRRNPDEITNIIPALLITDKRPDEFDESALRLVVPLKLITDKYGSMDAFLTELVQFVRKRDMRFLERFEDKYKNFWDALKVIDLKPNMFGFGVKINDLINLLRKKSSNKERRIG